MNKLNDRTKSAWIADTKGQHSLAESSFPTTVVGQFHNGDTFQEFQGYGVIVRDEISTVGVDYAFSGVCAGWSAIYSTQE